VGAGNPMKLDLVLAAFALLALLGAFVWIAVR
jgi:hypothetical protein